MAKKNNVKSTAELERLSNIVNQRIASVMRTESNQYVIIDAILDLIDNQKIPAIDLIDALKYSINKEVEASKIKIEKNKLLMKNIPKNNENELSDFYKSEIKLNQFLVKCGEKLGDLFAALIKEVDKSRKTSEEIGFQQKGKVLVRNVLLTIASAQNPVEHLKAKLEIYIARIDSMDNFKSGFIFFKESRAVNRKVNYLLAKKMLADLNKRSESLEDIFSHVGADRKGIAKENLTRSEKSKVKSSIWSKELNDVVKLGKKLAVEEKKGKMTNKNKI